MASLVFDLVMIAALGSFTLFCFYSSGLLFSYRICGPIRSSVFHLVAFGNLVFDTITAYADAVYDAVVPYMIAFAVGICVLEWAGVVRIAQAQRRLNFAALFAIIVVMIGKNGGNEAYKWRYGRYKLYGYT